MFYLKFIQNVVRSRNSKNMPEAVQSAVKDVLVTHGGMSSDQADGYLRCMDKDRRYQAETWS